MPFVLENSGWPCPPSVEVALLLFTVYFPHFLMSNTTVLKEQFEPIKQHLWRMLSKPAQISAMDLASGIPDHTRSYQTLPDHTTPLQTTPDHTRPYQTTPDHTRPHQIIPDHTRPHQTTLDRTGPYQMKTHVSCYLGSK